MFSAAASLGWGAVCAGDPASTHCKPPDVRRGGVFQSVREDLVQKILAPSSRCQKGGRGKLGGPSDPQTSRSDRKGGLYPS